MNMLSIRAPQLCGAVVVGALALAACGDDSDESEDSTTTTEAPSTTEADAGVDDAAEPESEAGDAEASGEATQPGTSLALGEPATIPIEYNDNQGLASMVVVGIEEGDVADMADFDLDDGVEGNVPYYVTFSMTKVSGGELSGAGPESDAGGLLDDGAPAQELSLIGSFEPCDTQYADEEFDAGETYETCRVFMAPEGSAVTGVEYYGDYDGDYYESPITWAP